MRLNPLKKKMISIILKNIIFTVVWVSSVRGFFVTKKAVKNSS